MVPKCTSWRGHKFEARYSKTAAHAWPKFDTNSQSMATLILDATRNVTYECDICVRCGHVIDHMVNEKAK